MFLHKKWLYNWFFRVIVSMTLIWTVNDYFYIAGSLNAENLAGNIFTNFSLLSLTELPSVFIGQFLMGRWWNNHIDFLLMLWIILDRYGRRWVHCLCMILATLPLMLCVVFVNYNGQVVVALTVISKVASNVGWFIMWVQCVEVSLCTFYIIILIFHYEILHRN